MVTREYRQLQNGNLSVQPVLYEKIPVKVASRWNAGQIGDLQIDHGSTADASRGVGSPAYNCGARYPRLRDAVNASLILILAMNLFAHPQLLFEFRHRRRPVAATKWPSGAQIAEFRLALTRTVQQFGLVPPLVVIRGV